MASDQILLATTPDDFDDPTQTIGLPLQAELELIAKHRDISNDVFLMDDLRIYENPPGVESLSDPGLPADLRLPEAQLADLKKKYPDFFPHAEGGKAVWGCIGETHSSWAMWFDQGYIISVPHPWAQIFEKRMKEYPGPEGNTDVS